MNENIIFRHDLSDKIEISSTALCEHKPPYVHFKRQYHEYILYYILSGELFLEEGGIMYHLKENDMILLDPTRQHLGYKTSTYNFFYCHFDISKLMPETSLPEENCILFPKVTHFTATAPTLDARNLVTRLASIWTEQRPLAKELCSNMVNQLLILAASQFAAEIKPDEVATRGRVAHVIPELIYYLNREYASDITSESIELQFSYNFDYLNRQFKKWTGKTIFNYLNSIRVDQAKQLLETGYYTIANVASMTGFKDVYYFSRVFKKYTGVTPGHYSLFSDIKYL